MKPTSRHQAQETLPPDPTPKKFWPLVVLKIILAAIVLFLLAFGLFLYHQAKTFSQSAQVPLSSVFQTIKRGWQQKLTPKNDKDTLVFLILGTNRISNREFVPELTDSMLLTSLNTKTGHIGFFSVPRDLWSIPYQTKIDAFYVYGHDKYPQTPEQFPAEIVEQMTGISIDHTIVLSPANFADVIDAFGGIRVDVTRPFVDNQFPNPDVDVRTTNDPKLLYMTVQFQQGTQLMNGRRALEYVRSRHSEDDEGNDIARSRRQREVITSLFTQLQDPRFYTNVTRLGNLYHLYNQDFARYLSSDQVITLIKTLYPLRKKLHFIQGGPTVYPDNSQGSIYHPNFSPLKDGQWVYLIHNQDRFQQEIRQILFE